jgi:hypothetical protein
MLALSRGRRSLGLDGIVATTLPLHLQSSLELLLERDPAMRVRLHCQLQDVRFQDAGRGRSPTRGTCISSSTHARPTPQ